MFRVTGCVPGRQVGEGGVPAARGQGDAERRGSGAGRRDAGDDMGRNAGRPQSRKFLIGTREDEWIAALEANDEPTLPSMLDQQVMNGGLQHGMFAGRLADVDQLGLRVCKRQDIFRDQPVVDNHMRLGDQPHGLEGQKIPITRPGADERNGPNHIGATFSVVARPCFGQFHPISPSARMRQSRP